MNTLSRPQALSLLVWIDQYAAGNWGGWGKYPALAVGASFLQYDTNQCQINLSEPICISDNVYNCITDGRPVGTKWDSPLRTEDLQEAYEITDEEIKAEIASKENAERRELVNRWLSHAKEMLINDSYAPIIYDVEAVYLKTERHANDNYMAPLGIVHVGETKMFFDVIVEWRYTGKRGKNGPNKKNIYRPTITEAIQEQLNKQLEIEASRRKQQLHVDIAKYEAELLQLN